MSHDAVLSLAGRTIGQAHAPFVIAEVAQAHDGSLGTAHAYIDAVARTGASAVKFQTHIASAESTKRERFRTNVFVQDETRYDYWRRIEFTAEQWAGLATHAREKGLVFLSTPFSHEAVELLDRLDVPAWKIGSGEVSNLPLLERVARTGRPVILSSGMSSWSDLDRAVVEVGKSTGGCAILQCTTAYPCPPQSIGLNVISELEGRYGCVVGLSDHSGTIFPSLAAVTLGASIIEVHVVLSRESFGPDVTSSVTTGELADLVKGVQFVHTAVRSPVAKDEAAASTSELRLMFGKSIVAARPLSLGSLITEADVAFKKPGDGIPAARLSDVVGRRLLKHYGADEFLKEADLE